jgi:hypothetical protein
MLALLLASLSLYSEAMLAHEKPRFAQQVDQLVASDIQPFFTRPQQLSFAALEFDLPLYGAHRHPLEFYAVGKDRITLPVVTLLFVEDLSKAYAWLLVNRYSTETVDEYAGMLHYRAANELAPPLLALHIPDNALEDPVVNRMFERLRNTAYAFMVLHEFGHLHGAATEEQADLFALDIMKRNSEIPLGLLLYLEASLYLPPETHPVSAPRLIGIANYLDLRVLEFVEGRFDRAAGIQAIHSIASRLRASADWLSDAEGQRLWAEQAKKTDVAALRPRRQLH